MEDSLEFDWDDANTKHIARHDVARSEAEQVIQNDPLDLGSETVDGEGRMVNLGITNGGKLLVVVTTMRENRVRVVTAFRGSRALTIFYVGQRGI